MASRKPKFTAASSALGYLYQARFALGVSLPYAYSDGQIEVAIERLDDVSFEENGAPIDLLQTKHHVNRTADLTDTSPDLWKTLRVWSELALADPNLPSRTRLALVTTSKVAPDTVAWLLRPESANGVVSGEAAREAAERLSAVAEKFQNKKLKAAFTAFLDLTPRMRSSLLSAVRILDSQPTIDNLEDVIEQRIRMLVPRGKTAKAREMLEGWWWARVIKALFEQPAGTISVLEIEAKLDEIRESLQRDALATEYEHANPPDDELATYDSHGFVRQLKAIGVGGNRVEYAKRDYYRAFAQRSHWLREHVVLDGEIARFEATLVEEWQPRFAEMCERHAETDPDARELREAGREIYEWVEREARFPFRALVKRFLNVGSFHILANAFRVGWHRDYDTRCRRES